MIKEIKFGGYTAKPSDYECPDGDLAITSNLVPDDGALRPIMPPKVIGDVQADERFIFIHENIGYKHYIIEGQEGTVGQERVVLKWTDDNGLEAASAAPAPGSGATADTGRYGFHGQTQQGSDEAEPLDTSTIPISEIQDEEGNRYPIRIIDDNAYGVWDGSDSELADNVNDSQPFIGAGHWLVTEYGQYIELADEDLGTIVDQTRFIAPGNGDAFIMRDGAYLSTSEEIDYTDVSNHMYVHLDNEWIDLGVIRESQEDEGEGEGDGESEAKPDVDDEEDTPASTEPTTIDIEFEVGEGLRDITAVGNILIVASSLRMYYVLWRQNMDDYEDGYYLLGNEVPKVELEFALEGAIKSKTFSNVKLELENDGSITPEDAWEVAKRYAYQFNNIQKLQYSNWVNINYSLEVNKEYCFKTEIDADNPWYQIQVEGKVNDVYQRVITLSPTKKRTYTIRSKGFTELRLRVQANARDVDYISNTLIIEKGAESDISISKPPKSDGKTFTALMSVMNTYTHAQQEEGKFIYPFFVRYTMCLYDGNYIQQSEPVLMLPSTGYVPFMEWDNQGKVTAHSFISDLQYRVRQQIPSGWEDIITKVDIFISPFCYPYKQGEEFSDSKTGQFEYKGVVYDANNKETFNTIRQEGYGHLHVVEQAVTTRYAKTSLFDFLRDYHDVALPEQSTTKGFVEICPVSMEERMTNLKNTSTYYKIASLSMDEIKTVDNVNFTAIDIERGTLNNLVTLPTFKDNMLADRRLVVGDLHTYNNRLHVFGSTWRLPDAPSPRFLNQYNNSSDVSSIQNAALYVYCRTPQGTKIIKTVLNNVVKYKIVPISGNSLRYETHVIIHSASWFFYPDTSAYKAIIIADISNQGVSTKYKVELDLKQHDLLTGAYWLNDDINSDIELIQDNTWEEPMETGRDLLMPTSIYVSEADNPFVFRSQSVVNVGAQRVIELAAAARPLSQGQFGQFPLYAFTDEGVWALETTQTGSYIARQPFARDVLLSREAVTSLDDTVAFLSKRGLMMLAGRDAVCVSDILDNDVAVTEFSGIGNAPGNIKPFKEYIIGARILYDYTNQRLIVYSPTDNYAYVYSLRSKQWGMRISGLLYHLNSYPDALAVEMIDNDNKLVNLSEVDETVTEGVSGTIITRPLKLDYPDALKTIDTLIVRGMFKLSDAPVKTILYGSRNLYDWVPVWSSNNQYLRGFRGTPYKFFRLVITCDLKEGESVSGCTVSYNPRYTNRLR